MPKIITLVGSSTGKKQVDRDTPLALVDLDERINVTSTNWVETAKTIEDIMDCIREEVAGRETTRMLRRLPIEANFHARTAARILAYLKGVAADPTGATVNGQATVTIVGTSGNYRLKLPYEGISPVTAPIAYNATAAQFKYAVESLDNVGFGNTTVGKVGGVYTVEWIGKRAAAPIPVFIVEENNLAGGAATVTPLVTVVGSQRQHLVTEAPDYQPPYTSLALAFEDEPGSERLLVGAVFDNVRFRLPEANGIVTMTADIIARDLQAGTGLDIPPCVVYRPMRTGDCRLIHNGVDYSALEALVDAEYFWNNGILTGNSAYPGRGVKPGRLERARQRTRGLNFRLRGGVTNALYEEALTNPEANILRATALRVGVAGDGIEETLPNNLVELDTGGGIALSADNGESVDRYVSTPTKQGATAPSSTAAFIPQATAFLST